MTLTLIRQDLAAMAAEAELTLPEPAPRDGRAEHETEQRLHPAVQQAAHEALAGFRASPEHAALIADLPAMNLHQLRFRLQALLEGPHFEPLFATIRSAAELDIDPTDMIPKAISLGAMVQGVLVVGLSGSVGYVTDIDLKNGNSGIYVGGAIDIGAEAGLELAACLGFWRNPVDKLKGTYVGEEVDIDDGLGLDEAAFTNDDELALIFIGFDLGLDDGMENTDYYFFEFDPSAPPIYQPGNATYLVQLWSMQCENSKDDWDTIYFEFLQDDDSTVYRFPAWDGYAMCQPDNTDNPIPGATRNTINPCSNWSVGLVIKFNSSFKLRLHIGDQTMADTTITAGDYVEGGGHFQVTWDPVIASNQILYTLDTAMVRE